MVASHQGHSLEHLDTNLVSSTTPNLSHNGISGTLVSKCLTFDHKLSIY